MAEFKEKYINPFTDYGFKRLFGEELSKDLLLDFLNELLHEEEGTITSLTYLKNERLGIHPDDRHAAFDLYCRNEAGEKFIVELQKTRQQFFKDRTVYYSTFPIREQGQRGDWNFELKAVYTIAILDFRLDKQDLHPDKFRHNVKLTDVDTCQVFYDKLTYIYLEMPKFAKPLEALESRFDKWMYLLRNLNQLDRIPVTLKEGIFKKVFAMAEIAKFSNDEVQAYEDSLKAYRDLKNSLDYAKEEGIEIGRVEGREEGKIEVAITMLKNGIAQDIILSSTGLSKSELASLRHKLENPNE